MKSVAALRAEEARLEAALRLTPEFQQLEAVRAALKIAYGVVPEKPERKIDLVTRILLAEFRRTGRRAQARDLRVAFIGVEINVDYDFLGSSIATVLGTVKAVFNKKTDERGQGWGLVEWSQPAGKIEVAPAPSFLLLAPRSAGTGNGAEL
jgi:hypothetical protein